MDFLEIRVSVLFPSLLVYIYNLDLLFHVFFLQRYSRLLEESSSGGRSPAHFAWLLLYATTSLILLSPLVSMPFLGSPLSSSLVYIWSRRDPDTRLSFLGLLVFTAPYLPWVLMGFSLLLHGSIPKDEIMGVVVGHGEVFFLSLSDVCRHVWISTRVSYDLLQACNKMFPNHQLGRKCTNLAKAPRANADAVWYFFSDVYPSLYNGSRPLDPPAWWIRLFEGRPTAEEDDGAATQAVAIDQDIAAAAAPEVR